MSVVQQSGDANVFRQSFQWYFQYAPL